MSNEKDILFLDNRRINYIVSDTIVTDIKGLKKNMGISNGLITASNYKNKYSVRYHDDLYYVHKNAEGTLGGFETLAEAKNYLNELFKKEYINTIPKPKFKDVGYIQHRMNYLYLGANNKIIFIDEHGFITTRDY